MAISNNRRRVNRIHIISFLEELSVRKTPTASLVSKYLTVSRLTIRMSCNFIIIIISTLKEQLLRELTRSPLKVGTRNREQWLLTVLLWELTLFETNMGDHPSIMQLCPREVLWRDHLSRLSQLLHPLKQSLMKHLLYR